jgi:rubrerythrin
LFEIASFVRNSSQNVRHAFWIIQDALEMLDNNADKITAEMARKVIEKEIKSKGCVQ